MSCRTRLLIVVAVGRPLPSLQLTSGLAATLLAVVLALALPGCVWISEIPWAAANATDQGTVEAYGFYGTGDPLDRPNQIRREVVFGEHPGGCRTAFR